MESYAPPFTNPTSTCPPALCLFVVFRGPVLFVSGLLQLRPIRAFEQWLERMGIMENGRLTSRAGDPTLFTAGR